jgi:hypothetical protein
VIDFEQISRMPPGLRFRLVEAVAWRSANQSDIARLQRLAIEYHENHTHQGERTDLRPDETCTQVYVQVKQSKRRANSTERAAQYWGESEATVWLSLAPWTIQRLWFDSICSASALGYRHRRSVPSS